MLSERQAKILHLLIEEYLDVSEPVSSGLLKKKSDLSVSGATIRNELQELTEQGYVIQPHTSAGRIPTDKGYRYFVDIIITRQEAPDVISREIEIAQRKIEKELAMAQAFIKSLTEISDTLHEAKLQNKQNTFEVLKIIGSGRTSYDKNISLLAQLMEELENL